MQTQLEESLVKFRNGKLHPQAFICLGQSLEQIKRTFRRYLNANEIQFVEFKSDGGPSRLLDFIMRKYDLEPPFDKKTLDSKLLIKKDDKNLKNIPKEFFKNFKTKNDPLKIILIPGLDSYVDSFKELFYVFGKVAMDLKGKKIPILLLFHFKEFNNFKELSPEISKVPVLKFRSEEKKIQKEALEESIQSKTPASISEPNISVSITSQSLLHEEPESILPLNHNLNNTLSLAIEIFQAPKIREYTSDPDNLDQLLAQFQSKVVQLHGEYQAGYSPNELLLAELGSLSKKLTQIKSTKILKPLIPSIESLTDLYLNENNVYNSISLTRIIYTFYTITKDKSRFEFAKKVGRIYRELGKLELAAEFLSLGALKSQPEDAEVVAVLYNELAEQQKTINSFLERAYLYKALAASYLAGNTRLISQMIARAQNNYSYEIGNDFFPHTPTN